MHRNWLEKKRILIEGFKEMFLYPLECREVPLGS